MQYASYFYAFVDLAYTLVSFILILMALNVIWNYLNLNDLPNIWPSACLVMVNLETRLTFSKIWLFSIHFYDHFKNAVMIWIVSIRHIFHTIFILVSQRLRICILNESLQLNGHFIVISFFCFQQKKTELERAKCNRENKY